MAPNLAVRRLEDGVVILFVALLTAWACFAQHKPAAEGLHGPTVATTKHHGDLRNTGRPLSSRLPGSSADVQPMSSTVTAREEPKKYLAWRHPGLAPGKKLEGQCCPGYNQSTTGCRFLVPKAALLHVCPSACMRPRTAFQLGGVRESRLCLPSSAMNSCGP